MDRMMDGELINNLKNIVGVVCVRVINQTYTYLDYLERPKKSAYVCGSFSFKIVKNVNAS